jgi:hypothetical protein
MSKQGPLKIMFIISCIAPILLQVENYLEKCVDKCNGENDFISSTTYVCMCTYVYVCLNVYVLYMYICMCFVNICVHMCCMSICCMCTYVL